MNPHASIFSQRSGFAMVYVLSVGVILLILGGVLFQVVGRHHEEILHFNESQEALYLAEAGVGFTIQEVRKAFEEGSSGGTVSELAKLLTQQNPVPSASLMSYFDDSWTYSLGQFAGEVDPTASIRVDAWFEKFDPAEGDSAAWVDPVAKKGLLTVQSTGKYKGVSRTVTSKRSIWAGNMLPPVVTKFSLRMTDGFRGKSDRFNTMSNDYDGNFIEGSRPLMVYNHALPDDPFNPQAPVDNEPAGVYAQRGWVWVGGSMTRLNLTSGPKDAGEIFELYQITDPGNFKPIKFNTPLSLLPPPFASVQNLPWDNPQGQGPRNTDYKFGHSLTLDGFHDRSSTMDHDAMYEGNLFSVSEKTQYGAKASSLHLFGDCRKGFQSRTKVIGNVNSAFPRFARLEVEPQEADVAAKFNSASPAPMYFLPSTGGAAYDPNQIIKEFLNRAVGGPVVKNGTLFPDSTSYTDHMCKILELSYADMYNLMGETSLPSDKRTFPPTTNTLQYDEGLNFELRRDGTLLYKGPVSAPRNIDTIRNRVQVQLTTIDQFWKRYYSKGDRVLRLNTTVQIMNPGREPFMFPPSNIQTPLEIEGAGLILLEQGNVVCNGVRLRDSHSTISIVAPNADTVTLANYDQQQLNLVAPKARLAIQDPGTVYGSVEVGDTLQSDGGKAGNIRYREAQDPTRENANGNDYRQFYRACLSETDKVWHD